MAVDRGLAGEGWRVLFSRCRVSVLKIEAVMEVNGGDGTTL